VTKGFKKKEKKRFISLEVTTSIKVQQQQFTLHAVCYKVLTLDSLGLLYTWFRTYTCHTAN